MVNNYSVMLIVKKEKKWSSYAIRVFIGLLTHCNVMYSENNCCRYIIICILQTMGGAFTNIILSIICICSK